MKWDGKWEIEEFILGIFCWMFHLLTTQLQCCNGHFFLGTFDIRQSDCCCWVTVTRTDKKIKAGLMHKLLRPTPVEKSTIVQQAHMVCTNHFQLCISQMAVHTFRLNHLWLLIGKEAHCLKLEILEKWTTKHKIEVSLYVQIIYPTHLWSITDWTQGISLRASLLYQPVWL